MGNLHFYYTFNEYKTYTCSVSINHRYYEINIFIILKNISYVMFIHYDYVPFKWYLLVEKPVYKPHPHFDFSFSLR